MARTALAFALVFLVGASHAVAAVEQTVVPGTERGSTFRVSAADGGAVVLFTSDGEPGGVLDGSRFTYDSVFVTDMATAAPRRLSGAGPAEADDGNVAIEMSADGRYATFASAADGISNRDVDDPVDVFEDRDVFRADLRTGALTVVNRADGRGGRLLRPVTLGGEMSADGNRVLFVAQPRYRPRRSGMPNDDLFMRDVRRGRTLRIARGGRVPITSWDVDASGRYVAYRRSRGPFQTLWVVDTRTRVRRRVARFRNQHIADAAQEQRRIVLSRAGRRLLFTRYPRQERWGDARPEAVLVDVRTRRARLVVDGAQGEDLDAVGERVALLGRERGLVLRDLRSGAQVAPCDGSPYEGCSGARLTPNGAYVTYVATPLDPTSALRRPAIVTPLRTVLNSRRQRTARGPARGRFA